MIWKNVFVLFLVVLSTIIGIVDSDNRDEIQYIGKDICETAWNCRWSTFEHFYVYASPSNQLIKSYEGGRLHCGIEGNTTYDSITLHNHPFWCDPYPSSYDVELAKKYRWRTMLISSPFGIVISKYPHDEFTQIPWDRWNFD